MRGRKPKPLKLQEAEGDPRKRGKGKLRQQLEAEAKAARGLPVCPDHLAGRPRAAWQFWKEELEGMRLDCRPDAMMLEGACVAYGRAVDADLLVAKDGAVVDDIVMYKGEPVEGVVRKKKHPAVTVSNSAWSQVRAFCSDFGLSPVSRTRLAIEHSIPSGASLDETLSQPRLKKETVQ